MKQRIAYKVKLKVRASDMEYVAKLCRNRIMRCPVGAAFECPFGFDKYGDGERDCYGVTKEMWENIGMESYEVS